MNCLEQEPNKSTLSSENEEIDSSWLSTITLDINNVARLKFEEEFKLSEARTHMLAYDKLRNFRQKFSENSLDIHSQEAEKRQLMESAKCLDEAKVICTEIAESQQRIDVNMAKMSKMCTQRLP